MSQTTTKWIANNAVTNAKAAQAPANTIKGNNTGSTANVTDLTVSQAQTLLGIPTSGSPLAVNSGGTGQSSLTANNVILGNGTSPVQFVAPGTSGNVLTSNGTTWISQTPAASGTVTSVAFADASATPIYSISGSPVTTSGTLTQTLTTQAANAVFAGPTSGPDDQPTFRSLVTADIPSLSSLYLPLTGGTMTGDIDMGSHSITNLAAPVNPNDAATKAYVDNFINATSWKTAVVAASTGNIDLSTATDPNPVDGITLSDGDRVLLKNQTAPAQNGIYVAVTAIDPTTWIRSSDMDSWSEVPAAAVFVESGTINADIGFVCTSQPGGTLGTTAITFVQFSSAGAYSADNVTLQLISGVFSIKNLGVGTGQIAAAAVTAAKLGTVTDGITTNQSGAGSTIQSLKPVSYAYTITGTDITNQFLDITTGNGFPSSNPAYGTTALSNSVSLTPVNGPTQNKGVDFTISLTGGSGGSTRITFAGDLATGGNAALVAGDVITIMYSYL